jgi:hypothetical protein
MSPLAVTQETSTTKSSEEKKSGANSLFEPHAKTKDNASGCDRLAGEKTKNTRFAMPPLFNIAHSWREIWTLRASLLPPSLCEPLAGGRL